MVALAASDDATRATPFSRVDALHADGSGAREQQRIASGAAASAMRTLSSVPSLIPGSPATTSTGSNGSGFRSRAGADAGPSGAATTAGRAGGATSTSNSGLAAPLAVAAQSPVPACQGTTPLGLPGGWTCTFDDEFNGTSLNTNVWVPQETAASGYLNGASACYVNSPDTISVSGGYLNLSVRQVDPFTCPDGSNSFTTSYEAGMVSTYGLFDQTYGAFEVSAKLPPAEIAGLQETFWLYPQNLTYGAWPASGEIDFAEFYSDFPGLDVPYIHYSQSSTDPNATAYDCLINQDAFNTYGVEWTPTSITVLYNGQPCLVDTPSTGSQPFDQPFFIALTQALGVGSDAFLPGTTPLPDTTEVDWVRAWTPAA
jgi:beta-glucanase (GH16 family)